MKLGEWLKKEGLSDAAFARSSGVGHKQLVGKYRLGSQIPSPMNMRRIADATGGEVTANDFFGVTAAATAPSPTPPHQASA